MYEVCLKCLVLYRRNIEGEHNGQIYVRNCANETWANFPKILHDVRDTVIYNICNEHQVPEKEFEYEQNGFGD